MTRLPWFRIYDEIIDDIKIMKQPPTIRWYYIEILCCINRQNRETGRVPTEEDLTFLLRQNREQIDGVLTDLFKAGLIKKDKHGYYSESFKKRQFKSDNTTERVQRFRERSTKHTESESYTESYTDTETEHKKNNNVALSSADIKSEILKIANKNKNNKSDKSFIIDLLKKIGMSGNIALEYTNKYPCEYLLRKIFLLEYYKNNTPEVKNDIAWIRSAIEYDNEKFPEHDEFFQWFKSRKEKIMDNDKTPHQLKQIIGRS